MNSNAFQYSVKVWLTSVAVAPLLFLMSTYYPEAVSSRSLQQAISDGFFFYIFFAFTELVSSFFTWLLFLICIQITVHYITKPAQQLVMIFFEGIFLTIGSFLTVFSSHIIGNINSELTKIMFCNCLSIGAGVWLYQL
jgi:hypothetical protein